MGYYRPEQGDGTGRGRERAPRFNSPLKRTYFRLSNKRICKSWLSYLANLQAEFPHSSLHAALPAIRVCSFGLRGVDRTALQPWPTQPCSWHCHAAMHGQRDGNKRTGDKVWRTKRRKRGEEKLFICRRFMPSYPIISQNTRNFFRSKGPPTQNSAYANTPAVRPHGD